MNRHPAQEDHRPRNRMAVSLQAFHRRHRQAERRQHHHRQHRPDRNDREHTGDGDDAPEALRRRGVHQDRNQRLARAEHENRKQDPRRQALALRLVRVGVIGVVAVRVVVLVVLAMPVSMRVRPVPRAEVPVPEERQAGRNATACGEPS